jgi:hypothetical protein
MPKHGRHQLTLPRLQQANPNSTSAVFNKMKVERGEGNRLFANWENDNTQWHMRD